MKISLITPKKETFDNHRSIILNCVNKNDLILGHANQTSIIGVNKFHLKLFVPEGTPKESYERAIVEGSYKKNTTKCSVIFLPHQLFQECIPGSVPYIQRNVEERH